LVCEGDMMGKGCKTCAELSDEMKPVEIESIRTYDNSFFNWNCVIVYCPKCGEKINYKQWKQEGVKII
jgi:RNase P subunit RPR2